jgi:branched-chain amino acid transport system ATP-binding protein
MSALLEVADLHLAFGGVKAVDGLSFQVHEAEIVSVIGPNGAGKTSAFNCITGFYRATSGAITIDGTDVTRLRPSAVAARGVSRTFQNVRLFGDLPVLDNVRAGTHLWLRQHVFDALLHTPRYRRTERVATDEAHRWLDFVGLRADRTGPARALPYGEQRRVEIARALAGDPELILLDEPLAGLSASESVDLTELFTKVSTEGITVLLVEHDVASVLSVSKRVLVLDHGRLLADGTPDEVSANPEVRAAYLGEEWT